MNVPADSQDVVADSDLASEQEDDAPQSLTTDPFDDSQVSGLFFPGAGRQELMDQVVHLLRYGPSLLFMYGDQGVGKHFFADHLIAQLDTDLFDVAVVNGDVMNIAHGVLHACTNAWHSRQPLELSNFREKVVAVASDADLESKILLCVVRHSQFLDQQTVDMIAELLASCSGLPVKFLLLVDAQELQQAEQLNELLEKIPDHYVLEMLPLGQQETADYLQYRLRTAGMGQVHFSESQVEQIYNHSLGNLVRVNDVARALLIASLPKPKAKTDEAKKPVQLPWLHLGALAVVVTLLLVLFFTRSESEPEPAMAEAVSVEPSPSPEQLVQQPKARVETEKDVAKAPVQNASPEASEVVEPDQETAQVSAEPNESVHAQAPSKPVVESKSVVTEVKPAPAKPAATEKVVESAPKIAKDSGNERTQWLKGLPPDHYTVQLLGAKELKTVHRFLATYPSLQNLVYYKTWRKGLPWYVVVQGNYPNYDAAKAATLKYPSKLQKQGPWIRKLGTIQKQL